MDNKKIATKTIELVGGEKNVLRLTHCFTRLRFVVKDESKVNLAELNKLDGVLKAQNNGGQTQVIVGDRVAAVYGEIIKMTNIRTEDTEENNKKNDDNWFNKAIQIIVGIFTPIMPAVAGAGLINGLVTLLIATGLIDPESGLITILSMVGNSVIYFLPFFLAIGAARVFKTKEPLAMALAAGLMHPDILNLAPAFNSTESVTMDFLGLPLPIVNYSSSVIPIILAVWVLSHVYKVVDKVVPSFLKIVLTPVLVLVIMVPFELIALAPIGTYLGNLISSGVNNFFDVGGVISGAVLGFFRPILVMFGAHYSLIPIQVQQIGEQGFTLLMTSALAANFAQAGAALGVFFIAKNKTTKSLAATSSFTATFGITEPAIYGVNLKFKKPFFAGSISAAIVAGFFMLVNAKTVSPGVPGLLSLTNNTADKFIYIIIGVIAAFAIACVLTIVAGIDEENDEESNTKTKNKDGSKQYIDNSTEIFSPIEGKVQDLSKVEDKVFSQNLMGKGVAIIPSEGKVFAPFEGEVVTVLNSKHAIGIKSKSGVELLIHVGIDTTNLNGLHFTSHVEKGDTIKQGDLMLEFDIEAIKEKGYSVITPVIVTNSDDYLDIVLTPTELVNNSNKIMTTFL
ncbi:PTS system, beta-glucosides-specific IIC component [Halolactibacillus halophilus]|uniref:PTS system beta-glucoside-specific EIIBCA component n=1 Tax=Halolactibacillus halophilus TaxID=306540 RepID=A0A1I5QTG7_9BACI|nr:beta-glucoside-specific PTS transporter subunit IIABC [Halolactibacillus halophilus]GEM01914.1 PTS system beta-glucoside-specific EIIBCA component [Halolactibacillus halophilus]SFP49503.1 PTS system, beta-glucosides-specific IIC component [Halolactibacillus halophilus]